MFFYTILNFGWDSIIFRAIFRSPKCVSLVKFSNFLFSLNNFYLIALILFSGIKY
jgi:hypothetical protein